MTRPKVLKLAPVRQAHNDWSSVEEIADIVEPSSAVTDKASLIKEASTGAYDGVVAVFRDFESIGPVDAALLDALPPTCRFICHNGAGYDQIDVDECTARRICVSNTPTAVNDATADIGMFLLLGALRNLGPSMAALRRGEWRGPPPVALGRDPQGKTLGILGMGGIGRNMANKARAFGMHIIYHNRSKLSPENEEGAHYVDMDTLLAESDVLSLNLPLNVCFSSSAFPLFPLPPPPPDSYGNTFLYRSIISSDPTRPKSSTRHSISRAEFARMKRGIVIVNTARGAVMDEAALVDALADGTVASAGLDVFEEEPKVHPSLIHDERVFLVPHMGTCTYDTEKKMESWAIGNVRKAVAEAKLKSIVPEQRNLEKEL
ncbi:glyoxylate reductase [Geosmithia morbida]|uniref:Glyoxylate reductase n=1 Tax=Geosmithia morbida TaxID=1094350 RepID=A0A9P4YXR7_9HYPO|nr:glyoxylate reductase [Geosmithia morbida]KAF4122954.1 glyoxylate reductase [Geosmithia morbida]